MDSIQICDNITKLVSEISDVKRGLMITIKIIIQNIEGFNNFQIYYSFMQFLFNPKQVISCYVSLRFKADLEKKFWGN